MTRIPYWVYSDPGRLRARAGAHLRRADLVVRRPRAEVPEPGDFKRTCIGEHPVVVVRDPTGRCERHRQSLRAPRRAVLPAPTSAHARRVHVPVPPVDLRPAAATSSACRFDAGLTRARAACRPTSSSRSTGCRPCGHRAARRRLRLVRAAAGARGLPRPDDARLLRPRLRRPPRCACSATCASASAATGS